MLVIVGPYCEVTIPFCTIMEQRFMTKEDGPVCHNEGECESVGTQNFVCTCLPGFTGNLVAYIITYHGYSCFSGS